MNWVVFPEFMTRHIVIDLFDDAEELDTIGPWEVFAWWTDRYPADGWQVHLISDDGLPRRAAKGLTLTPTAAKSAVTPSVIVQPGGIGTLVRMDDASHREWLRRAADSGVVIASVCTGARVLAAAGLLHERPFTTYHSAFGDVAAIEPTALPRPAERWVDAGDVLTGAGISAGIDLALHLVKRLVGPDRARQVHEGIEYHPAPPVAETPGTTFSPR